MTEPVIVLDHLSKSLGAVNAVQDLSFIYNRDGNDLWFSWGKWRRQNNHHANALRLGHPASGKATIASYDVWKDPIWPEQSSAMSRNASVFTVTSRFVVLLAGALITFIGAAFLLKRIEQ